MIEEKELFDKQNIPQSGWMKWEKVGDKAYGELIEISDSEAKGVFSAQKIFTLKQADDSILNVGLSVKSKQNAINKAKQAEIGDFIGFKFTEEIPPKEKGFHPAKSIEVFIKKAEF
jgi:hypothetical protein